MDQNSNGLFKNPFLKKYSLPISIVLVVLVLLGIIWGLATTQRQPASGPTGDKVVVSDKLPAGYKSTPVKEGQYPQGFPKDLVQSFGMAPFRGEDTIDGSGARQRIVEYYSTSTPQAVFELYKKSLPQKGWKVLSESAGTDVKSLYLTDSKDIFQVVAAPHEGGAQVALTYVSNK